MQAAYSPAPGVTLDEARKMDGLHRSRGLDPRFSREKSKKRVNKTLEACV